MFWIFCLIIRSSCLREYVECKLFSWRQKIDWTPGDAKFPSSNTSFSLYIVYKLLFFPFQSFLAIYQKIGSNQLHQMCKNLFQILFNFCVCKQNLFIESSSFMCSVITCSYAHLFSISLCSEEYCPYFFRPYVEECHILYIN